MNYLREVGYAYEVSVPLRGLEVFGVVVLCIVVWVGLLVSVPLRGLEVFGVCLRVSKSD